MKPQRSDHPRATRRAFTLLEVMLTLCLLVIIGALVWTATNHPVVGQRLRRAADQVQAVWGKARVEAMTSGRIQVFRYAPGTRQFHVETRAGFGYSMGELTDDGNAEEPLPPVDPASAEADPENSLPEGILFLASATELDSRAAVVLEEGDQQQTAQWSEPILFYPDGTTSNARLVLATEDGRCIELLLRGLTGVVTVGEPFIVQGHQR